MNDDNDSAGPEHAAPVGPTDPVGAPGETPGDPGPISDGEPGEDEPVRRRAGVVYLVRDADDPDAGDTAVDAAAVDPDVDGVAGSRARAESDDGAPPSRSAGEDWPWVAEWRAGGEPTPWATGLPLAAFSALVVAVAVWVLSAGLADRPIVAVLVNVLVAGGLAPAMWLSRELPVLRWIAAGALVGILCGWVAALLMLPAPP